MRSTHHLVIDAGASHVAGAVFSRGVGGRLVLEEFALETRLADPSLEPGWVERTAQAMGSIAARRRLRGPAALAVPGHLTLTKFIQTPAVAPAQREKVIRFEAAQNLPCQLDAVAWDYLVVGGDAPDLEIMLTAVKLEVMENLCAAAEAAGFPVRRAAASCLALHRALRFNYPEVSGPVLVADIGARSTNLVLAEPGGRFYARTFPLGGNAVTAAVAEEMRLDFARAEALKLQVFAGPAAKSEDSPAATAVSRAARDFIGRLQLEIVRATGNFSLRTGAAPPVMFYLAGGGSLLPGLETALREKFSVGVERYDPWRNVELSAGARAAGAASATHLLANLVGLAVPAAGSEGAESGLLPPTVRATREFRRRKPVLLGAVTLLALALLPPLWHFHRLAATRKEQAAEIEAQLPQLRARAERNRENLAKIASAQGQLNALQNLAETRFSWVGFLGDLQERLTGIEDVWLDQLTVVRPPSAKPIGPAAPVPATQLRLRGRVLDPLHPDSRVSADSQARVKALLASCASAPGIAAVGDERFDNSLPGLLRFDFTLTVNPRHPL